MALSERQQSFLTVFAKTGNTMLACKDSGCKRGTVWLWKKNEPEFAEALKEAYEDYKSLLEALALAKAKTSVTMLMFLMKAHMPALYGDKATLTHEVGNTFVDFVNRTVQLARQRRSVELPPTEPQPLLPGSPGNEPVGEAGGNPGEPPRPPTDGGSQLHDSRKE